MFVKNRQSQAIGIDIGTYAIKIVGLRKSAPFKLNFYSIINVPEKPDAAFLADAITRILKKYNALRSRVYLTISDESLGVRRTELPSMPEAEMAQALKWQMKDRLAFDVDKALLDFRVLRDIAKQDGSKASDVMLVAISREAVEKKIGLFRKMNLDIAAVNVPAFALENILKILNGGDLSHTVLLIDVGSSKTDIAFYKDRVLQFVRTIPLASGDITAAIRGPYTIGTERKEFSQEEAEEIKKEIGIPYEPMRLEKGITSIQVLTLMRGTLERFSKEIKRSIEYYISEVAGEGVSEARLVGGGANLKNLDRYLSEELNLPVKRIDIPKEMEEADFSVSPGDLSAIVGAIGAALDTTRKVNLLPEEYRLKKVEFAEAVSIRLLSIIMAALLAFSFLVIKSKVDDYGRRVENAAALKEMLSQVKALSEKIEERERLVRAVTANEVNIAYIMKSLSNIIPKTVMLDSMKIETASKTMDITGIVYEEGMKAQAALTHFMEEMEKSPSFKDAQLISIQERQGREEGGSSFSVSCQLE